MKKVLFLLGCPDREALRTGEPISHRDFAMFKEVGQRLGVDIAVEFVIPDQTGRFAGKDSNIKIGVLKKGETDYPEGTVRYYRDEVLDTIRTHEPDLVMACGPLPLKCLYNKGNSSLEANLRKALVFPDLPGVQCGATQSLGMVAAKPGIAKWLTMDTLIALMGNKPTKWGNYRVLMPGQPEWAQAPPALMKAKVLGVDLETFPGLDPWHPEARIRMVVISHKVGHGWVVQARRDSKFPAWVRKLVKDPRVLCGGSNIKFDYKWFKRFGYNLTNMHDTSTAEHVLDCTSPLTGLKFLSFIYTPHLSDYDSGCTQLRVARGGNDKWELLEDHEMYLYAGGDGEASIGATLEQRKLIKQAGLLRPFTLSMELYKVLADMEHRGTCISDSVNRELGAAFEAGLGRLRQELISVLGPFNPNSPQQLAGVLREIIPGINLRPANLNRQLSGYYYALPGDDDAQVSTDREVLEREAHRHPILATLLEYRKYATLFGTFVQGLRNKGMVLHPDGRYYAHTSYRTDRAETYRLASQGPNLQNIPRKPDPEEDIPLPPALNIKRQFISRFKGGSILEADLSQAEIRIAAHLSQDPEMMAAINSGEDVHRAMTSRFTGKAPVDVTKLERTHGKAQNFLVIYGGGANTLAKKLGITKNEAKAKLLQYFTTFHQLKEYMEKCGFDVMRDLFSESEFGYRRPFRKPEQWRSREGFRIKRQAWNHKVQNGAACCVFVAMSDLEQRMQAEGMRSLMDMQVHDSIKIDVYPGEEQAAAEMAKYALEHPTIERYGVELTVPLVADVAIGPSWGEMEDINV